MRNTVSDIREELTAWAFLLPALVVLGIFGLFPIFYALFVSLHKWKIKKGAFVGLDHYLRAVGEPSFLIYLGLAFAVYWLGTRIRSRLEDPKARWAAALAAVVGALWLGASGLAGLLASGDPKLYNGLKVTLFYALGTIPIQLGLAMVLATLLFGITRGTGGFRTAFFLPYVTPVIASAVVFRTLFSPHPSSVANRFWGWLGFEDQRWLHESKSVVGLLLEGVGASEYPTWVDQIFPSLALVSIILYNIWVYIGYDTVILLAGLSAIPRHYYEAASIDGASNSQQFRHITLPLISPTLFFLSMVAVIGTFKAFNHIYMMRTAGALDSVDVVSIVIFDQIFQYHNAGYASTLAFVLFLVILVLTIGQNRILGKRVFYGD